MYVWFFCTLLSVVKTDNNIIRKLFRYRTWFVESLNSNDVISLDLFWLNGFRNSLLIHLLFLLSFDRRRIVLFFCVVLSTLKNRGGGMGTNKCTFILITYSKWPSLSLQPASMSPNRTHSQVVLFQSGSEAMGELGLVYTVFSC